WLVRNMRERTAVRDILRRLIQSLTPAERDRAIAEVRRWAGSHGPPVATIGRRPLTVDELRRLAGLPGIQLAAHTEHHSSLRLQSPGDQRSEIKRGREHLEAWIGHGCSCGFAYPFGVPGVDFDEHTKSLVQEHGFEYAVSNHPDRVTRRSDRFALPRLAVPDIDGASFARWLAPSP
ncbi:MAG: polysaccharide deacetylase family protein, partial [Acidobacteriota bacterium]|nr:polysaccharide deacetylase family protein [Acidobacteriota bacterium]